MSDKLVLATDGSVQAALNKLRNSVTGDHWLVIGYEGKNTLVVVADGEGGLDAAKVHCLPTECRYILLRKDWKVEISRTVKFAFIDWTPNGLAPTRRALLSTHKGQLRDILGQTHVTHQASFDTELDESVINDKIGVSAGTKSLVTDKSAWTHESKIMESHSKKEGPSHETKGHDLVPKSVTHGSTGVKCADETAVKAAIAEVRKDSVDTNWMLLNYSDDTTLALTGKGSGGIEELKSKLDSKETYYAFFRTTAVQDKTTKVIFCSMKLLSMSVSTVARAKLATHKGFVDALFSPVHHHFNFDNVDEFTPEVVEKQVAAITLTALHVVEKPESGGGGTMLHRPKTETKSAPAPYVPLGGTGIHFEDEEKFKAAFNSVKNDSGGNNWFVARWAAKDTLGVVGVGSGGVEECVKALETDNINWAYIRVVSRVDKTDAVKFAYIKFQPESVGALKKGAAGAKKGDIDKIFQPHHVSRQIEHASELTTTMIMDLVTAADGTKSHVK